MMRPVNNLSLIKGCGDSMQFCYAKIYILTQNAPWNNKKPQHNRHMKYSIMKQMNILEDIAGFKGWLNEPPWLLQFSTVKSTKNREQKSGLSLIFDLAVNFDCLILN